MSVTASRRRGVQDRPVEERYREQGRDLCEQGSNLLLMARVAELMRPRLPKTVNLRGAWGCELAINLRSRYSDPRIPASMWVKITPKEAALCVQYPPGVHRTLRRCHTLAVAALQQAKDEARASGLLGEVGK